MGKETILGEIGTHAYNLATFVTLEKPLRVSANLRVLTYGRKTYDDGQLVFEYSNGRLGRMWLSFVAAGNEHGLSFKIHGTEGSLEWSQEQPESLYLRSPSNAEQRITPGFPERMSVGGYHACRLREGHPEGYVLAFANLYRDFADKFISKKIGVENPSGHFPDIYDGVETMKFYDAASRSNQNDGAWISI
jgi:predicted dehydrogenase